MYTYLILYTQFEGRMTVVVEAEVLTHRLEQTTEFHVQIINNSFLTLSRYTAKGVDRG